MPTIIDSNTGLVTGAVNQMAGDLQQTDMIANIKELRAKAREGVVV